MSQETYAAARLRLWFELKDKGWTISKPLKRLWAEPPGAAYRLWFHPQGVYFNCHSLFLDIRGLSVEDLLRAAEFRYQQGD